MRIRVFIKFLINNADNVFCLEPPFTKERCFIIIVHVSNDHAVLFKVFIVHIKILNGSDKLQNLMIIF